MDTTQLVRTAQAGNRSAFDELTRAHESMVFSIALRWLHSRHDAEDLTQDVFSRAWMRIKQLRQPEQFSGWLRRITERLLMNKSARQQMVVESYFVESQDDGRKPLDHLVQAEDAHRLRVALDQLSEWDRRVLVTRHVDDASVQEISQQLGRPVGTVKRLLFEARQRLREILPEFGFVR